MSMALRITLKREAEALRLLKLCLPYVKDWVSDYSENLNDVTTDEWIIARDLLKELEG